MVTSIVVVVLNCGSTRESSPLWPWATQTARGPAAMPVGVRSSSATVAPGVRVIGSMLAIQRSVRLPTQTVVELDATGPGPIPTGSHHGRLSRR